jgi:hypothetical protein
MNRPLLDVFLIAIIYGFIYSSMSSEHFEFKNRIDPYYFSFSTISSVGYGDFTPKTNTAKLLVMSQQALLMREISNMIKVF